MYTYADMILASQGKLTPPMVVGYQDEKPHVLVPEDSGSNGPGAVEFAVRIGIDGPVTVELNVLTPHSLSDSIYMWFDSSRPDEPYRHHLPVQTSFGWVTVNHEFVLNAGKHTLHIGNREAGVKIREVRIVAADPGTKYKCDDGQGQEGRYIKQIRANSKPTCAAQCDTKTGCIGFDFSTKSIGDSCRLYSENTPRDTKGGDNRKYCYRMDSEYRFFKSLEVVNQHEAVANSCLDVDECLDVTHRMDHIVSRTFTMGSRTWSYTSLDSQAWSV